jgi:hypothetical protein
MALDRARAVLIIMVTRILVADLNAFKIRTAIGQRPVLKINAQIHVLEFVESTLNAEYKIMPLFVCA